MKRFLIKFFFGFILFSSATAQNCDLYLSTQILPGTEELPYAIKEQLLRRVMLVISKDGVLASSDYAQFYVGVNFSTIYKDVLPSAPNMTALTTEMNLVVGDRINGNIYESTSVELRGVGNGDERTYLNAIRNLKTNNAKIKNLVADSKVKILDYYNNNYTRILALASRASSLRNYEEALFWLSSVPDCCVGYDEVEFSLMETYNQYVSYHGFKLLTMAKNAWMKSPDMNGANEAGEYLVQIEPDAACYGESLKLYDEIKSKVKQDWDFEMRKKYEDELAMKREVISAAKEVGVAWGNHQQENTTNIITR